MVGRCSFSCWVLWIHQQLLLHTGGDIKAMKGNLIIVSSVNNVDILIRECTLYYCI